MTQLLEQAIEKLKTLKEAEPDTIASGADREAYGKPNRTITDSCR